MRSAATINADLDKLRALRGHGRRIVRFGDRSVEYRSDQEIAAAISALENELEMAQGVASPRTIVVRSPPGKGWL